MDAVPLTTLKPKHMIDRNDPDSLRNMASSIEDAMEKQSGAIKLDYRGAKLVRKALLDFADRLEREE